MPVWTTSTFDQIHTLGLSRREMQVLESTFADREDDNFNFADPPRIHRPAIRIRARRS